MKAPNVRLRTNVVCRALYSPDGDCIERVSDDDLLRRLDYWELRGLSKVYPLRFPHSKVRGSELSPEQRAQRDAYIKEQEPDLWPRFSEFKPISMVRGADIPESKAGQTQEDAAPVTKRESTTITNHVAVKQSLICNDNPSQQDSVVRAPLSSRKIVIAPPGTGKTHTLINRIAHIIESGEISNPASEFLVLSFTRAAVGEIIDRVSNIISTGVQDNLRYVNIRTFDSFATWALIRHDPQINLRNSGYDDRIRRFVDLLRENRFHETQKLIEGFRYLIVDEVQDLCGLRAVMALEILKIVVRKGGGVLLLGDPAQALYDYSVNDDELKAEDFIREAGELLKGHEIVSFDRYHRYKNQLIKELVSEASKAMGSDGRNPDGFRLQDIISKVAPASLEDVQITDGRVAILTRTNLEAAQISRWLSERGIPAYHERGSGSRYWPGWVGRLVFGFEQDNMSRQMASRRWQKMPPKDISFDCAWDFLVSQGVANRDRLSLLDLADIVRLRTPKSVTNEDACRITVSTVHRSKGLEYDTVYVLEPRQNSAGNCEQIRILYVAATRARQELRLLMRDKTVLYPGYKKKKPNYTPLSHFHIYSKKEDKNWILLEGLDDIDRFSMLAMGREELRTTQDTLGRLLDESDNEVSAVRKGEGFELRKNSTLLGYSLSDELVKDLRVLGRRYRSDEGAVRAVSSVRIEDFATVAFEREEASVELLGAARLLVLPVIQGEALIEM